MSEIIYDVAIVGYGPSGAIAACILGQAGLNVYVCDRDHDIYEKPRAIALDHEILRVFQNIGIVDKILPFCEPFTDSCYYGTDGQLIRQLTMVDKPYPLGYVPSMVFTQPSVEAVIRDEVNSLANVIVEKGMTLFDVKQNDKKVTLSLKNELAETTSITSRYVIACDGASSTTRKLLNIKLEDLGFNEHWLVIDLLMSQKGLEKLPQTSVQYCEPERPTTFIIGPKNHRRWEISLKPDEVAFYKSSSENVWTLLERWVSSEDATLWRQASYQFHALVAEQWRDGRVFLAGDAAHQQPPFLGQGMCQGVRDIVNLSWKLKTVLTQKLPENTVDILLNSYGLERKEHVQQLTHIIKKIGSIIGEKEIDKAKIRDQLLLDESGGVVKPLARQDILPAISLGLVSNTTARGSIFPQPVIIQDGKKLLMDQLLENGWKIFTNIPMKIDLDTLKKFTLPIEIMCIGSQIIEKDQVLENWFSKFSVNAVIVRPDHYIYATANNERDLSLLVDGLVSELDLNITKKPPVFLEC